MDLCKDKLAWLLSDKTHLRWRNSFCNPTILEMRVSLGHMFNTSTSILKKEN